MKRIVALALLSLLSINTLAAAHDGAHPETSVITGPHPTVPAHADWVRPLLGVIAGLFVAAIPVGLLVRANAPQEAPQAHDDHAHGHDDHGHGGHGGGHH